MKMTTVFIYKSTLLVFSAEVDDRCALEKGYILWSPKHLVFLTLILTLFLMPYSGLSFLY